MEYNLNNICDNYTKAKNSKAKKECIPKELNNNLDFLFDLTIKLGHLPVIRNEDGTISATKILDKLRVDKDKDTFGYLRAAYLINRSTFIDNMAKSPLLGSLTPLALYALKRDKDIAYSEWDKNDPQLKFFLGQTLEPILNNSKDFHNDEYWDIGGIRRYYLTTKSTGNMAKLTASPHFTKKDYAGSSRVVNIIKGQIWLANAAIRKDSMILDLNNWDNMPAAYDEVIAPKEVIKEAEDLVW